MPANAAVYIQVNKVDLKEVFEKVKTDRRIFKSATYYDVTLGNDIVRFNVMDVSQVPNHIQDFLGYIASLNQSQDRIDDTSYAISHTKVVLGLKTNLEFEENLAIYESLFQIADKYNGFVFVHDSVLLPNKSVLVGPLLDENHPKNIRQQNVNILSENGYIASQSLPVRSLEEIETLRPYDEISKRLFSLKAILFWVIQDDETTSSERILKSIERNDLKTFMTDEEIHILNLDRSEANEQYASTIGWKFENMWVLAWVLGFEIKPEFNMGQISHETIQALIYDFLPSFDYDINYMDKYSKKTYLEVFIFEDLFYCAHNAIRCAQLGEKTIPMDCDLSNYGGSIHEKRHSLTWCLSPNVKWEDTDLST